MTTTTYRVRQATRTCWDVIRVTDKQCGDFASKIVSTHATKADAVKAASVMANDGPYVPRCGLSLEMHFGHQLGCCKVRPVTQEDVAAHQANIRREVIV